MVLADDSSWTLRRGLVILVGIVTLPLLVSPAASDSTAVEGAEVDGRFGHAMVWDTRTDVSPECALGCAYLIGGSHTRGPLPGAIQRFSALHGDVANVATLPLPVASAATVWTGERAYVFGGQGLSATDAIQTFDPVTGNATVLAATLPHALYAATAVWVDSMKVPCTDGCAYIFGGLIPPASGTQSTYSDEILRFDPAAGTVVAVATLPPVAGLAPGIPAFATGAWAPTDPSCVLGCAYLAGGTRPGYARDTIQRFDPVTNTLVDTGHRLPVPTYLNAGVWNEEKASLHLFQRSSYPSPAQVVTYDPFMGTTTTSTWSADTDLYGAAAAWDPAAGCALVTGGFATSLSARDLFQGVVSYRPFDVDHDPRYACWPSDPRPGVGMTTPGTPHATTLRARHQPDGWYARVVTAPSHGSLTWDANDTLAFTYTPDVGWTGTDSFTYHFTDGSLATRDATHTVVTRAVHLGNGTIRAETDLPAAVSGHTMFWDDRPTSPTCILGCAYILGSDDWAGHRSDKIHRFSAIDGTYTEMEAKLPVASGFMTSTWTGSTLYMFGGSLYSDRIVSYDPITAKVKTLDVHLPDRVVFASSVWDATVSADCPTGCAYVFGGYRGGFSGDTSSMSSAIVRFDPSTPSVTTIATFEGRSFMSAVWDDRDRPSAGCTGGCAYLFGGRPDTAGNDEVLRFNPATNQLQAMAIGLPDEVYGTSAVWDQDAGVAYLFGGGLEPRLMTDQVVVYDPVHDLAVRSHATLPTAAYAMAATADPRTGCVLVTGGLADVSNAATADVATYRPADVGLDAIVPCWGDALPPVIESIDARQVKNDRIAVSWNVTDPQEAPVDQTYRIAPDADGVADGMCEASPVPVNGTTVEQSTGAAPGFLEVCLWASNGVKSTNASVVVELVDDQPPEVLAFDVEQVDRSSLSIAWNTRDTYGPMTSLHVSYDDASTGTCATRVVDSSTPVRASGVTTVDTGLRLGTNVRVCLEIDDGTTEVHETRFVRLVGGPPSS